jgi:1,4-dihydroxy-2-naphthoate octaprenyltransferase
MKVVLPISGSVICFIISYIAFHNHEAGVGWLFLGVGLLIVLIGIAFGNKSE